MRAASKRGAGMSLGQGEEVPAMKNVLVLVRHGESEWNRLNMFTGWQDVDLTEEGVAEAHRAGATVMYVTGWQPTQSIEVTGPASGPLLLNRIGALDNTNISVMFSGDEEARGQIAADRNPAAAPPPPARRRSPRP